MKFEIYVDKSAQEKNNVRWRLKAKNGQIVATSGEAFHNVGNARRSIKAFKAQVATATVDGAAKGSDL